jgi:hypothetical protein
MDSPADVVRRVFSAVAERRYGDVASFVDPGDLDTFWRQAVSSAREIDTMPNRTAADYMRDEPGLPRVVAEYFAAQEAERWSHGSHLVWEYAGVTSASDVENMSPSELLARWIEARDPNYQLQRLLLAEGHTTHGEHIVRDPASFIERTVIGFVLESSDLAHVVYRIGWGGEAYEALKVASLRRHETGWLMRYDHDFLGQATFGVSLGDVGEIPPDQDAGE